ncbi:NAD-binding lipoprotein [Streptomyces sp. NPDC057910]|uniref:CASTOR/POLLUX-related putative ion channel n=1 Tax=Streptomyces sp. NPDC057910 TaxID=3346278 RepID=UPI0036E2DCB9
MRRRFRYWFDTMMSRGMGTLIGWMTAACFALVVPVSVLLVWTDEKAPPGLGDRLADIWQHVGAAFRLGGDLGPPLYVLFSVLLALMALLFTSTLIGLITNGVDRRLAELRKGRSIVLEDNHTVVFGWSEQVFPIVAELVLANANRRRAVVVILAPKDKVEMEDEIRAKVARRGSTKVVCRTGSPTDPADIAIVSPATARSLLILAPGGPDGDSGVVKTLLALAQVQRAAGESRHIVAALEDGQNHAAARLAAGPDACVLDMDSITAHLIVQTSLQPGLSFVYHQLLSYAGDEFYLTAEPRLVGRTFEEALMAYATSSVVGLLREDGRVDLNPPWRSLIGDRDRIIAISRDDDTVIVSEPPHHIDTGAIIPPRPISRTPVRLLVLGWNRRAATVIERLDGHVVEGSTVDVVTRQPEATGRAGRTADGPTRLRVTAVEGDPAQPGTLCRLDLARYHRIVLLRHDTVDAQQADNRTLVTLLHLRELGRAAGSKPAVVTEMADDRNRELAPTSPSHDFIISSRLISRLMTQISESPHLARLFDELFGAEGSEIHLRPAEGYVALGRDLDFYTVVEAARRQGHIAIGYRLHGETTVAPAFGVRLNPDKRRSRRFAPGDSIIVLAGERPPGSDALALPGSRAGGDEAGRTPTRRGGPGGPGGPCHHA